MGAALGRKLCPRRDRAGQRLFEWGLHRPEGHVIGSSRPLDRRQKVPVAEVTGAALPPPGRRLREAAPDEEALDEEEREDRYMAAALDVFMDYRDQD